jgi:hypothetical protein
MPLTENAPEFSTRNTRWQAAYDKALQFLAGNVRHLHHIEREVLIEGSQYHGIWLECAPHESLAYRRFRPDVARNTQMAFFRLQRHDGQIPAWIRERSRGFAQIQMVVPIAATAWETARASGDTELLEHAYRACSKWDRWLLRYRNTRATGLIEGFCTFDTGQDNSPRWRGIPNECPHGDARRPPRIPTMPRLCPDLSATVYGGRIALAAMATALGKQTEADEWIESAATLRSLILDHLYAPEEGAFYDLDAENHFVRIRSDLISRVCGEHVLDQQTFDAVWDRQLHNEHALWAPYPFPSIAMDDPTYVGDLPGNSWGGPSQALTALRACRWMDHYERSAEFSILMSRWCEAMLRDMTFRQQLNPMTGVFGPHDRPGYSPSSLLMYEFTWRLAGIVDNHSEIRWHIRPGHPAADNGRFSLLTNQNLRADLRYAEDGAQMALGGKPVGRASGGIACLITSPEGQPLALLGISDKIESLEIEFPGSAPRKITIRPNERFPVEAPITVI